MILRDFSLDTDHVLATFSSLLLLGARQVGKTTLLKNMLGERYQYVLLEDPDTRELAINDPRSFFEKYPMPLIIDEFQYAPSLINYLQGLIDQRRMEKGLVVLTGSQNFQMMSQVTQSLAGRIAIKTLHGLSSKEIGRHYSQYQFRSSKEHIAELIRRGSYPELWNDLKINISLWMSSYVQTFLERDLRRLAEVGDLNLFERFLKMTAIRTGQVLNVSELARDVGVSAPTITKWLSILERSYVIRFVQPYLVNLTSRLKKSPKLYFLDTGLAAYLMGFRDQGALLQSPHIEQLFETLVYGDFIKRRSNADGVPDHYYLQTKSKIGVDFVVEENREVSLYEIKYTKTFSNKICEQLVQTHSALKNVKRSTLLMLTDDSYKTVINDQLINIEPWNNF